MILQKGQKVKYQLDGCHDNGLIRLKFSEPVQPNIYYHYNPSTLENPGDQENVIDELGSEFVEVRHVDDFFNEGLFAIRDIPNGLLFVQMGGIRFFMDAKGEYYKNKPYTPYLYTVGFCDRLFGDFTDEMTDFKKYNSTMAQKTNHSFRPNVFASQVCNLYHSL